MGVLDDSDEAFQKDGQATGGLKKSASDGELSRTSKSKSQSQSHSDSTSTISNSSSSLGYSSKDGKHGDKVPGLVGLHLKHTRRVQQMEREGYGADTNLRPPFPLPEEGGWAPFTEAMHDHIVDSSDAASSSRSNSLPLTSNTTAANGVTTEKNQVIQRYQAETGLPWRTLEVLFAKGILLNIPRDDDGELTTVGSIAHPQQCNACVFWYNGACNKGLVCEFCHLLHSGQKKKRIRMSKRGRLAKKAQEEAEAEADAPEPPQSQNDGQTNMHTKCSL